MLLEPIRLFVWFVGRIVLALRYRVKVVGVREVERVPGPYLFLPNHPAFADPPNVLAHLWLRFRLRPMLLETNFQNPVLGPIGYLLNAIRVPDLSNASAEARGRAQEALQTAIDALKAGDNVVLWPSGRLMRDGREHLGGARAAADILAAVPHVTAVLVRSRGLWGSSFSWADGREPTLIKSVLRGAGLVMLNFWMFTPRRRVTMTLEAFPRDKRPEPTRAVLNPWLEAWYNADVEAETPTFVPYHFALGPRTHDYPQLQAKADFDPASVKPATRKAVAELLAERLKREFAPDELRPETTFADLGVDSLDAMELSLDIERRFGFSGSRVPVNVAELWQLAEGKLDVAEAKPAPEAWFAPRVGPAELEMLGDTIPVAFLNRVAASPKDVAVADDLAGALTYERLLLACLVLAERFQSLPQERVGLMLPASVAGVTALMALHLTGKLPVILNWTTGPANMAHAVKLLGVEWVVTSKQFLDRAQITIPGVKFFHLEDVRATVGRREKLLKLLAVTWLRGRTVRRLTAKLNPDATRPAVVLFTSGSEKAPKAVPLTHANVLGDLRGALPLLELDRSHSGLVFLPLFHSFGHTVTGVMPLLVGVRVVYHPDPTDAAALVRKAAAYRTTATAATPTFWAYMLDKAKPGDLDSFRVVVIGAEKVPPTLFEKSQQLAPNAAILEGYGITECSPVVSVNPRTAPRAGTIGRALLNVELAVRDLDTDELLPAGKRGMLHVSGPNVFTGYIGGDSPAPFRDFAGKTWYVTGDLAELDADGYIRFHGRLKRFIKAGGEMISLPALEEPFARRHPPTDDGPQVAVEGVETPDGRLVVLFATVPITLKEANALLQEEGFRGVMRLDEVRQVERIPQLGTGKTDYKVLRGMLTGN